jgi:hypothetical protein
LSTVDVIVTETSKPVYLVLAHYNRVLFNIHLAPGAKISRIAMIGYRGGGITNLDPLPPVEVLSDQQLARCGVVPLRRPAAHWEMTKIANNSTFDPKELVRKATSDFSKYSNWFKRNFGQTSEPNSIGAMTASHVLVGPLPTTLENRVQYKALTGANVYVAKSDYNYSLSPNDYKAKKSQLIIDAAEAGLGVKLETLIKQ